MLGVLGLGLCVLPGCGADVSGSTGASEATPPPARIAFSQRLNTLCGQWNTQAGAAADDQADGRLTERYLPRFRALQPPPGLSSLYSTFLADLAQEAAHLLRADSVGAQHVIARMKPLGAELGAPACAR